MSALADKIKGEQNLIYLHKMPYCNRELSWVDFNLRVLEEAQEADNPIAERCKFLAITESNLDEFFMVRIARLKNISEGNIDLDDASKIRQSQLLTLLSDKVHRFSKAQCDCFNLQIMPALKLNAMEIKSYKSLDSKQKKFANKYFDNTIYPVLTPIAVDADRELPLLLNKSINILARLENSLGKEFFAVVEVPGNLPRIVELPKGNSRTFVMLEDIITVNLDKIFKNFFVKNTALFRITRDFDLEINQNAKDLVAEIKSSIQKREQGAFVRLEVCEECDRKMLDYLIDRLNIDSKYVYVRSAFLDFGFLAEFAKTINNTKLSYKTFTSLNPPNDFYGERDIWQTIRVKDRLVHHPYESFDVVVDFIRRAAFDSNVLAIKQTLYRVSENSPVVSALIGAAQNGKQVTVLVELKARFDEENNIKWAQKLEKAGCRVVYGPSRLKTHCKLCLVVRQERDTVRRYLHLSTGNYNDVTAKLYTDIGFFTCDEKFCDDASMLFNMLTGYCAEPSYGKFITAPNNIRSFLEKMIKREIENAEKGVPSEIIIKVNSIVDKKIIRLLYQASGAGVKVKLIVRGICCLVPNVKGFSENITVTSIVGRFLEHSRIFIFGNGGNRVYFIGSADLMPRNLDRRIELLFPVEENSLKARLNNIIETMLKDTKDARTELEDASYRRCENNIKFSSQEKFIGKAEQAQKSRTQTAFVYG